MFDQISGLPLHPLAVHVPVIFIPLLVAGALVYALVPRLRARIWWAVVALAVIAPLGALLAKLSGDAFRQRLIDRNMLTPGSAALQKVDDHGSLGTMTLWFSIALAVFSLVLVFVTSRRSRTIPPWGTVVVGVIVVALAIGSGIYVFRTGDAGAHLVWEGY